MFDDRKFMVVGAGKAFRDQWGLQRRRNVIGVVDPDSDTYLPHAWGLEKVGLISDDVPRDIVVFVLTPDHYPLIEELVNKGFKTFVVEKPLVSGFSEIALLEASIEARELRIYAADHYVPKWFPIAVLLGKVTKDDPRLMMVENFERLMKIQPGRVESIKVNVSEFVTLANEPAWWLSNPKTAGVLKDLFPHALTPILSLGLLEVPIVVGSAYVNKLNPEQTDLVPITAYSDIDMRAVASLRSGGVKIDIHAGATLTRGVDHDVIIVCSGGRIHGSLTDGAVSVVYKPNKGQEVPLALMCTPHEFMAAEIDMMLSGSLAGFDGHVGNSLTTLRVADQIRRKALRSKS